MIKIKNKKALEDSLAVWIIAIFILIFLIFIFIGGIGAKKISGDKTPEVRINSLGKNDLFLAESFLAFLNKKTDSGKTVKDLIFEWADDSSNRDKIENGFKDFFKSSNSECSIANINSGNRNIRILGLENYIGPAGSRPHQDAFLDRGMLFELISEKTNLIKISLYAGECENGY